MGVNQRTKNNIMIKKGDKVRCNGIGYPHWKDREFVVEVVFKDGTIGLNNGIRVSDKDFVVIP